MKHQTLTQDNIHTFKKITFGNGNFITHQFIGIGLTLWHIKQHLDLRPYDNFDIIGTKNNNHKYYLTIEEDTLMNLENPYLNSPDNHTPDPHVEGQCATCRQELTQQDEYLHYLADDVLACSSQCLAEYLIKSNEVEEIK